jgi:hypothetical protein
MSAADNWMRTFKDVSPKMRLMTECDKHEMAGPMLKDVRRRTRVMMDATVQGQ